MNIEETSNLQARAKKTWLEYQIGKNKYFPGRRQKNRIFQIPILVLTIELLKNVFKLFNDNWIKMGDVVKRKSNPQYNMTVEVMDRNALFEDAHLKKIGFRGHNRKIVLHMADEELYREVLCSHWLLIKNISANKFRQLLKSLGDNPWAFLSGDRKENSGRLVIDNNLIEGRHPFIDKDNPIFAKEVKYWSKIFPKANKWFFWSRWYYSRTHSPIYTIKDADGGDLILLPIHIDPKNGMTIFSRAQDDNKGMWEYHQFGQKRQKYQYVGTGLYELGCKYFIYLMKRAHREGFIDNLEVIGENKLCTSGSIYLDDKFTEAVENLAKIQFPDTQLSPGRTPLLFIHGWPFSSKIYDEVISYLKHEFMILSPDLPGFGDEPRFGRLRHNIKNYIKWLKTYLDSMAIDKVVLVGSSYGGAIAIEFARNYPQMVSKLILNSVPYYYKSFSDQRIGFFRTLVHKTPLLGVFAAELNKRTLNKESYFASHPFVKKYVTQDKLWDYYKEFCKYDDKTAIETFEEISRLDIRQSVPKIKAPVLVIAGGNDSVVKPGDEYQMMQMIKNGRLAIIDESDHALPVEHPREMANLIRGFAHDNLRKIDHLTVPTIVIEPDSDTGYNSG